MTHLLRSIRSAAAGCSRCGAAVLLALLLLAPAAVRSQTSAHHPGRWSEGQDWTSTPIHLNLLRGRDSLHSQILWWQAHRPPHDQNPGFRGGLWGWRPLDTLNTSAYPTAAFSALTGTMVNTPDSNIFCAGHTQTADRLMVLGGTALGSPENGGKFNRTFDPVTRSWAAVADMRERRWYATGTLLANGNVLVSSGSQYGHLYVFGGRRQAGGYAIDETYRFGFVGDGKWDPPVEDVSASSPAAPDTLEPMPREGHTFTQLPLFVFGGLDSSGEFRNDLWAFERHELDAQAPDYQYQWYGLAPTTDVPAPRSDHAAVILPDVSMVIFGGRRVSGGNEFVWDDVWRAVRNGNLCAWNPVTISGASPPARFGHAMATLSDTLHLMFGGVGGTGQSPSDTVLWRLRFTDAPYYANAVWEQVSVTGPAPAPRWDHSLVADPALNERGPRNLVLFGGRGSFGGAALSGEMWRLWVNGPTSFAWAREDSMLGEAPAARGGHAAAIDVSTRQMLLTGGETASGSGTDSVYVVRLAEPGKKPEWRRLAPHTDKVANHAVALSVASFARLSEVYEPGTNSWTPLDGAPLLQKWYPFTHLLPDTGYGAMGRVFNSGPGKDTYWMDPSEPAWTKLATTSADTGGGAAVMYRPGKIMKAGAGLADPGQAPSNGATRYIDLTASSPQWQSSGDMLARFNHNLVILPTGQVLVVGGTATVGNSVSDSVARPEIWDPGTGAWYGATGSNPLAEDLYLRDYHSSAILLPDGRVLSAGGNANRYRRSHANLYSPPYLFTAGGAFATRPKINSAPQRIRYGKKFMICSPWNTNGQLPCLIRPGAATHGYDQNQRYVPLAVDTTLATGSQLLVTAPPDSFTAPPGDYLLFILNSSGVPAVAAWVRLGSVWNMGDTTPPGAPSTFYPEVATDTSLTMVVAAPGDDGAVGHAWEYELRWSADSLHSGNVITAGALVQDPRFVPGLAGTYQFTTISVPNPCAYYHYAIRTGDESGNWSDWTFAGPVRSTGCGSGGCGVCEARASDTGTRREAEDGGSPPTARGGAEPASTGAVPDSARSVLIASFERTGSRTVWTLARVPRSELAGLEPGAAGLLVQSRVPEAGWITRYGLPASGGEIGIRSLVESGRVVLLEPGAFEIAKAPRGFELSTARSSREGEVSTGTAESSTFSPGLSDGDTLTLAYDAAEVMAGDRADQFILYRPTGSRAEFRASQAVAPSPSLVFSLGQNRPNPFDQATRLTFALPHASHVRFEIFDMQGRRVGVLADRVFPAGQHELVWDRRTASGAVARPGIYFYRIEAGEHRARRRMVVLL